MLSAAVAWATVACNAVLDIDDIDFADVPPGVAGAGGGSSTGAGTSTGTAAGTSTGSPTGTGGGGATGGGATGGTSGSGGAGACGALVECDGQCIDPATNDDYCGATGDCLGSNAGEACGVDTPAGDSCVAGVCVGDRELITNGDFSSSLSSWSTANNPVGGEDTTAVFYVSSGSVKNETSTGPSARVLIQDFTVPTALSSATFSLGVFQDPVSQAAPLDPQNVTVIEKDPYDTGGGGEQNAFRIDLVDPGEDQFYATILYELYTPTDDVGQPGNLSPVIVNAAALLSFLQGREGEALRLRIAQVESTFPWDVEIDDVSLSVVGH